MATFVIGDIHGCWQTLQRLLERIGWNPVQDELWLVGDLVNRGPQSLEVLRWAAGQRRLVATLGNHDLYLLRESWKYPDAGCPNRELDRILRAPDRERLIDWLQHMPLAHWSDDHRVLMVHAGVVPQWTAERTLSLAAEVEERAPTVIAEVEERAPTVIAESATLKAGQCQCW